MLSNDQTPESDRYARHRAIEWLSPEALRVSRLALVGVGAVGNEVLKNFLLLGVGGVDVFDFDVVERHNLTRAVLFREEDVGRPKAEVAAARSREIDPSVDVRAFVGDFWKLLRVGELPAYTAVIAAVDNFQARLRLNAICTLARVDLVNTGVDTRHVAVETFPFSDGPETACYECHLPASVHQRVRERFSCGWLRRRAFAERVVPTTAVTSAAAGALAVAAALRLGGAMRSGARRVLLDTATGASSVSELERNPSCPSCSGISEAPWVLPVGPRLGPGRLAPREGAGSLAVLSDPLLIRHRCVRCEGGEAPWTVVFRPAEEHDDSLATCPRCGAGSVAVDIRDQVDLAALAADFPDRELPVKYLTLTTGGRTVVLEPEREPCPK